MRINTPNTGREYPFPSGETLVSTTDLKGRITHCNATFVTVSGFTKEELLGQPHNLVRHPDMPEEAYRDMWATIQAGKPWSATVKNRRKDGDHYWVRANVTPLMEDGGPVGYMSVRTEASRAQIDAAEALYRQMREEAANGRHVHSLSGGELLLNTAAAQWRRRLSPGPALRLGLATGSLVLLSSAGMAWLGAPAGAPGSAMGSALLPGAVAAAVATWATTWLAQAKLVRPFEGILDLANRMAAGDLTQRVEAEGASLQARLVRSLAQLNVNLRSIVRDARNEVENLRQATQEIASGNEDLSARTESQAASLEETASSMEQITSTVRNSADAARRAAELAGNASGVAQQGSDAVGEVTKTMQVISTSSHRITEIIGVIDGIAFQTNILALNAAVEAARAGEQGRGFAVVASEVRALAQRSAAAAREIKQLIEASRENVEQGNRLTAHAQQTIAGVVDAVREVSAVVDGIRHGADEQLMGISQINEAVTQLDSITQQNAALVEQMAASAVSLRGQTAAVADAVSVFRIDQRARAMAPDAVALRRAAKAQAAHPA